MSQTLIAIQTLISVALIGLILIQARGTGFGRGSAGSFSRRGIEKLTFRLTFILLGLFLVISVLRLFA